MCDRLGTNTGLALLVVLALHTPARAQEAAPARLQRAMDACANGFVDGEAITSASIGVFHAGRSRLAHYGELDPALGNAPTATTVYEIASITKLFTGLLVSHALVEGKLTLDQEVAPLLPEAYDNLAFGGAPVRVRHLLTHTAGLPFQLDAADARERETWGPDLPARLNAVAPDYDEEHFWADLHSVVLTAAPGTNSAYSNVSANLAASVLEHVYEAEFRDLVREKILAPAGMTDTTWELDADQVTRKAPGFGEGGAPVPDTIVKLWGAADGLKSTPADLMRFLRLQLEDPSPAIERSRETLFADASQSLACFWHVERRANDSPRFIYHGGAFGAQNVLLLIPERELGISIVTNRCDAETAGRLFAALEALLAELQPLDAER